MTTAARQLWSWSSTNVYAQAVAVFAATIVSDFVWAKYMASVARGDALSASSWAVGVIILGAFLVLSYVHDKRLVIPAATGAFIGTYLAV